MSNISNRHSVVPFVAGKTSPLTGQRLAKVGYKTTKKQKAKFASVAVSVPTIQDSEIIPFSQELLPYVREMLEKAQDGVIRSLYESNDGVLGSVSDDEIGIPACLAWLEAESQGGRLTKEMIEEWFAESLSDNLTVLIGEKLGFNDPSDAQMVEIGKHVNGYKGVLSSLAGGKTFLQPKQIQGCRTALSLCAEDDGIASRLIRRLDAMEKKEDIADLLEI